jgi:3-oxoacyl-[acyl-carrier-protein] synthase II
MTAASSAVVTGAGLAIAGQGGIGDLLDSRAPTSGGFDPATQLRGRDLRHKDRASRFALRAADFALRDAGLLSQAGFVGPVERTAVVVSSNFGNMDSVCLFADTIARESVEGLSPMGLPHTSSNVVAGWIAIRYGLRGPNVTVCNGATGGLDALHWAWNLIAVHRAEAAVVVGVEPDNEVVARLLGEEGEKAWLDGAGAVVVESAEHAHKRRARPRARLAGYARDADLPAAVTRARQTHPQPIGLWLTAERPPPSLATSVPADGAPTLDLAAWLGLCSGALGVLQCAAGVAHLDRGGTDAVLAMCGGADGDDAAAALLLTAPSGAQ